MKITYNQLLIIICLISANVSASTMWRSLEDKIIDSELIFKGVLIEKYFQTETKDKKVVPKNHKLITQTFTIFVFKVDKILKGEHLEETIEVKMLGGCDENNNICTEYSFNYNYETNDKAVMFLHRRKNSNLYKSVSGYETAYTVEGSVEILTTEGSINYTYEKKIVKNGRPVKKDVLTLDILKTTIENLNTK